MKILIIYGRLFETTKTMSSSRDEIMKEQLDRAIRELLQQLPYTKQVFTNPKYDLNQVVENELDFLLGAVLGKILERYTYYLLNRHIRPSSEEAAKTNLFLFSRASEFKNLIKKIIEV